MPNLFFDRHVPHLPQRMFDLVADLEDYPRFIPNCAEMVVKPDGNALLARMTISFGPITQSYTSRVEADRDALTILARAIDGPFRYLVTKWTFEPEGAGTRIKFDLDFKISNPLLATVAEPAFAAKQDEIMQAFADEADQRYGA